MKKWRSVTGTLAEISTVSIMYHKLNKKWVNTYEDHKQMLVLLGLQPVGMEHLRLELPEWKHVELPLHIWNGLIITKWLNIIAHQISIQEIGRVKTFSQHRYSRSTTGGSSGNAGAGGAATNTCSGAGTIAVDQLLLVKFIIDEKKYHLRGP